MNQEPPPNMTHSSQPKRNWFPTAAIAGALVLAGIASGWLLFNPSTPPEQPTDPRLDYAGPFRNIHPSVRYVPDEQCASCHGEIAADYAKNPMGRSMYSVAAAPNIPVDGKHNNPFEFLGTQFEVVCGEQTMVHRRSKSGTVQQEWDVHFVIGSGTRGHSYLTLRDGCLMQTPVSWYSQKQRWDLSPGFHAGNMAGRAMMPECLYCHANRTLPVEGSLHRYEDPPFVGLAMGCQRCHGPGELHVAYREKQDDAPRVDPTIVNPKHLEPKLREAVCEQCHLFGEARTLKRGRGVDDYRPGLPMEAFWSVFVNGTGKAGERRAVGHVEQMYESRCFTRSRGDQQLGCVSCHDPHRAISGQERIGFYRQRCLTCHETMGCKVPVATRSERVPGDSCIACHMPRYEASDIPHTAGTDHRIPRHPKKAEPLPKSDTRLWVSFYRDRPGVDPEAEDRDRFVALTRLALAGDASASSQVLGALRSMEPKLTRHADDAEAWEARAMALGMMQKKQESLEAFQALVQRFPKRESAWAGAAAVAEQAGKSELAVEYWRRALEIGPQSVENRRRLALLLLSEQQYEAALQAADAWIRLDAFQVEARTVRLQSLLALNRKADAQAEFMRIEALAPPDLRELRIRYERRLK